MAIYVTQGELGAGKGIFAAYIMSLYYNDGDLSVRCASNYPFYTEYLGINSSKPITVLPCNVRSEDLYSLGKGSPDSYKDRFGVLILDECASFLNSRDFRNSDRLRVLNWLTHARKWHWDVFLLVQHPDMLDSQVREALIENLVILNRLDHIRIPFISSLMEFARPKEFGINKSKKSIFPHFVQAKFYYKKKGQHDKPFNSLTFRAKDFYPCYDTDYKFTDGMELIGDNYIDMRAPYTLIPGKMLMNSNAASDSSTGPVSQPSVIDSSSKSPKKKGCLSLFIKTLFLVILGFLCFYIWSKLFNADDNKDSEPVYVNSSTVNNPPYKPEPQIPVLSGKWRLTGYLILSDSERYFILSDGSGNVRYHSSDQEYKGRFTRLLIGNELVTFYSGSSRSVEGNTPDLPDMLTSGVVSSSNSLFKGN